MLDPLNCCTLAARLPYSVHREYARRARTVPTARPSNSFCTARRKPSAQPAALFVRSESAIVRIRKPGLELDNLRDRVEHATQVAALCKRQDLTQLAGKIRLGLDPSRLSHLPGDRPRCAAATETASGCQVEVTVSAATPWFSDPILVGPVEVNPRCLDVDRNLGLALPV